MVLPVLGIRGEVLFPGMRARILLSTAHAQAAVRASLERGYGGRVGVFATLAAGSGDPEPEDLHKVGTVGRLCCLKRCMRCGRWVAQLRGISRIRTSEYVRSEPFREAQVELLTEMTCETALLQALATELHRAVVRMHTCRPLCEHAGRARAALHTSLPDELPGGVADLLAHLPVSDRQTLLEVEPLTARLEGVLAHVHGLLANVLRNHPGPRELHQ